MPKKTFEQAMKQLEQIVHELESGEISLEKTMNKFEEGIQLSKFCSQKLDETEKKVNILMKDHDGNLIKKPFKEIDDTD